MPAASHWYGLQSWAAGAVQAPEPSHAPNPNITPAAHEIAPPHGVVAPGKRHAPLLHVPPHPPVPLQSPPGSVPSATEVHWPRRPATSQRRQAPVHEVAQHTSSTQWADAHCPSWSQAPPIGSSATHAPPLQYHAGWHSPSVEHAFRQADPSAAHWYGLQSTTGGTTQVPRPSHEGVRWSAPAAQPPVPQSVS